MNLNQLLEIYPQAKLGPHSLDSDAFLNIQLDSQWISIPKSIITKKEEQLLQIFSISNNSNQESNLEKHPWFNFLRNHGDIPQCESQKIRFIQAVVSSNNNLEEWAESFKTTFLTSNILDSFWISDDKYILIEKIENENYSKDDFIGIAETLDINLNTKTQFFIGNYWTVSPQLIDIFNEELKIADHVITQISDSATSISQLAINYWFNDYIKKNHLFENYRKQLHLSEQIKKIIITLYEEYGNISSASKKLYLHRNTLQYQIEKFHRQTGFNLKNMNDLVFCYLLTI